jgi:hypothetical protein
VAEGLTRWPRRESEIEKELSGVRLNKQRLTWDEMAFQSGQRSQEDCRLIP